MLLHLVPSFSKLAASTIVGNITATSKTFGYLDRWWHVALNLPSLELKFMWVQHNEHNVVSPCP